MELDFESNYNFDCHFKHLHHVWDKTGVKPLHPHLPGVINRPIQCISNNHRARRCHASPKRMLSLHLAGRTSLSSDQITQDEMPIHFCILWKVMDSGVTCFDILKFQKSLVGLSFIWWKAYGWTFKDWGKNNWVPIVEIGWTHTIHRESLVRISGPEEWVRHIQLVIAVSDKKLQLKWKTKSK